MKVYFKLTPIKVDAYNVFNVDGSGSCMGSGYELYSNNDSTETILCLILIPGFHCKFQPCRGRSYLIIDGLNHPE